MPPSSPEPLPPLSDRRRAHIASVALVVLVLVSGAHIAARFALVEGDPVVRHLGTTDLVLRTPLCAALLVAAWSLARGRGRAFAAGLLIVYGMAFSMLTMVALGAPNHSLREENRFERLVPVLLAWLIACVAVFRSLRGSPRPPRTPSE